MPENRYSKLLDIDEEVLNPDYYQVLLLDTESEISPDTVEKQYKLQMQKLQHNRSTKYKDFIEFLKGELKTSRRILSDPAQRNSYDKERKLDAKSRLRELVEIFVQISQNLDEIELGEIHRRGRYFNLTKADVDGVIDDVLGEFGGQRVQASADAQARAQEILRKRAASLSETGIRYQERVMGIEAAKARGLEERRRKSERIAAEYGVKLMTQAGGQARPATARQTPKSQDDAPAKKRSRVRRLVGLFNGLVTLLVILVLIAATVCYFGRDSFAKSVVEQVWPLELLFSGPNGDSHTDDQNGNTPDDNDGTPHDNSSSTGSTDAPPTLLDQVRALVADDRLDEARRRAIEGWREMISAPDVADTSDQRAAVVDYFRTVVQPRWLADKPRWEWAFEGARDFDPSTICEDHLGFVGRGLSFPDFAGECQGLLLKPPIEATSEFVWQFGAPRKVCELTLEATFRGARRPLSLLLFVGNSYGLTGRITIDPERVRFGIDTADGNAAIEPVEREFPNNAAWHSLTHFVIRVRLQQDMLTRRFTLSGHCWPRGNEDERVSLPTVRSDIVENEVPLNELLGSFALALPSDGEVLVKRIAVNP